MSPSATGGVPLMPPALPFGLPPDEFAIVLKHTNCVFKNDIHDLALFVLCQLNRLGRLDSIEVFRDYYKTLEGPLRSFVTLSDHTRHNSYVSWRQWTPLEYVDDKHTYSMEIRPSSDRRSLVVNIKETRTPAPFPNITFWMAHSREVLSTEESSVWYKSTVKTTVLHIDEVEFDERGNRAVYSQKGCDKRLVLSMPVIKKRVLENGDVELLHVSQWLLLYYFENDHLCNLQTGRWMRWWPTDAHAMFNPEARSRLRDMIEEMPWFKDP